MDSWRSGQRKAVSRIITSHGAPARLMPNVPPTQLGQCRAPGRVCNPQGQSVHFRGEKIFSARFVHLH